MAPLHLLGGTAPGDSEILDYYSALISQTLVPLRLRELRRWLRAPPGGCLPPELAFPARAPRAWGLLFGAVPPHPRAARRGAAAPAALLRALAAQPWVAANLGAVLEAGPGPAAAFAGTPGGARAAARLLGAPAAPPAPPAPEGPAAGAPAPEGPAAAGEAPGGEGPAPPRALRGRPLGSCGPGDVALLLRLGAAAVDAAENPRRGVFLAALAAASAQPGFLAGPWFLRAVRLERAAAPGRRSRGWETVFRLRRIARAAGLGPGGAARLLLAAGVDRRVCAALVPGLGRCAGAGGLEVFLALEFADARGVEAGLRALVPRDWPAAPLGPPEPPAGGRGLACLLAEARTFPPERRAAAAGALAGRFFAAAFFVGDGRGGPSAAVAGGLAASLSLAPAGRRRGALRSGAGAAAAEYGEALLCGLWGAAEGRTAPPLPALEAALGLGPALLAGWTPRLAARLWSAGAPLRAARAAAVRWRRHAALAVHRRFLAPCFAALEALPPGPSRPCGGPVYLRALEGFWRPRPLRPAGPGDLAALLAAGAAAAPCPDPRAVLEGPAPASWGLPPGTWLRRAPRAPPAGGGVVFDVLGPGLLDAAPAERLASLAGRLPAGWGAAPLHAVGGAACAASSPRREAAPSLRSNTPEGRGAGQGGTPKKAVLGAARFCILVPAAPAACVLGRARAFPPDVWAPAAALDRALEAPDAPAPRGVS